MKKLLMQIIFCFFLAVPVFGGDVVFIWDENIEPDLAGYRLYQSLVSGGPYTVVDSAILPNQHIFDLTLPQEYGKDSYRLTNLSDGTYFWVLTAYDNEIPSLESGYSNEVTTTIITPPPSNGTPSAPTMLNVTEE